MKCLLLLFVLWCSSLSAGANHSGDVIDGYSCVSDYWLTISCVLNISGDPAGPNKTDYKLKFQWHIEKIQFTCPLVMMDHSFSCTVAAPNNTQNPPLCFSDVDKFGIELCFESLCHTVTKAFKPAMNIQLMPPYDVVVQKTPETFFITWKSGYENHKYLKFENSLQYDLLLQNPDGTKKVLTDLKNNSASIRRSGHGSANEEYCIKVKSLPAASGYGAIWSKWSPLTCWKADTHKEQENILLILIKYVGLACVAVGVLLFLFYSPAVRMRIKTLAHTPSPVPFFQPLFQEHKGNFQEWISPQGSVILQLKTEEMIKTDALIIVPKPITQDEAEDLQESLITQMMFTQCQSSYVGLPGMNGTPLHVNVNCLEDTPYTQLPLAGPQFGFGKALAVSVPPENVLDISCADSGCGCEDPSQSPECSQPNSPLHSGPPHFLCTDYCVLNKTAAGIIPVLISQASGVNVEPEFLQKYES